MLFCLKHGGVNMFSFFKKEKSEEDILWDDIKLDLLDELSIMENWIVEGRSLAHKTKYIVLNLFFSDDDFICVEFIAPIKKSTYDKKIKVAGQRIYDNDAKKKEIKRLNLFKDALQDKLIVVKFKNERSPLQTKQWMDEHIKGFVSWTDTNNSIQLAAFYEKEDALLFKMTWVENVN